MAIVGQPQDQTPEHEGEVGMGATYLHAVASLDGYIADEHDDVGPLHDW